MHKMCSDERKCAVMKGCLCSDELRRNKWFTEYLLLREHKEGIETCKKQHVGMWVCIEGGRRGVRTRLKGGMIKKKKGGKSVKKGVNKKKKKRSSEFLRGKIY